MTDSHTDYSKPLPTRRSLREAERARERDAAEREEAAKQEFIAQYEEEKRQQQIIDDPYDNSVGGFGFDEDDGTDPFAHPADDRSSAFYAAGPADSVFADLPVVEAAPVEVQAPVVQTTVNYFAIGSLAIAAMATALSFVPAAEVVTVPLTVLALALSVIGVARRKGGLALPLVALLVALAAAGWAGYHQFAPTPASTAAVSAPTTVTVTSTGKTIHLTSGHVGATVLPASSTVVLAAPYSATGTGTASITAAPVNSTDTVTCTITASGTTVSHRVGKPGRPVTCNSTGTVAPSPAATAPLTKGHR